MRYFVKTLIILQLAFVAITSAMAETRDKVYVFGYATCLGDSVIYLSAIQPLDSAIIDHKTKFLNYREDYARQMENALQKIYGKHFTSALVFSSQRSRLEKKYVKLRRYYNKKPIRIEEVPTTTFHFIPISVSRP